MTMGEFLTVGTSEFLPNLEPDDDDEVEDVDVDDDDDVDGD